MAIAALLVAVVGAFVFLRATGAEAAYPAERAKVTFCRKVLTRLSGVFRSAAVASENARLKREVVTLSLLRNDLERLDEENARLRRALGYANRTPGAWIPAAILSRGGSAAGAHRTLRTDKGSLAGVKAGRVVTVPEGLVGLVTAVTPHTSEVTLLADRSIKVSCEAELQGPGRPRGILEGGDEEMLTLRHLMGTGEIPPRTRILTTGLGGVFPRGIEVGTLIEVRQDDKTRARTGAVLPSVDPTTLEDVFIRRD